MSLHIRILVDGKPVEGKVVAIEASEELMLILSQQLKFKAENPDSVFVRIVGHAPYGIDPVVPNHEPDGFVAEFFSPPFGGKAVEAAESPVPENDG